MWILRYSYDLEDGTFRKVSCCLQRGQTYSIGRSSKNQLNIKNDKSISRNHISLTWMKENGEIVLNNEGKLTAAGGKYLKVGEDMVFKESMFKSKNILVELGTKPTKVEISWKDAVWDIPRQFADLGVKLGQFGIDVRVETADLKSTMIVVTDSQAHRSLFGLVYRIPVENSRFLRSVTEVLSKSEAKFDESWTELENSHPPERSPSREEGCLSGLKFYLIEQNEQVIQYTKKAIEGAGGILVVLSSSAELPGYLKSEFSVNNLVLIRSSDSTEIFSQANITFHTLDDIAKAIQDGSTAKLLDGVPHLAQPAPICPDSSSAEKGLDNADDAKAVHQLSEQLSQSSETPPVKKRRFNRRAIKPLDSLMFFAGGNSFKREIEADTSTVRPAKSPEESSSPSKINHSIVSPNLQSEIGAPTEANAAQPAIDVQGSFENQVRDSQVQKSQKLVDAGVLSPASENNGGKTNDNQNDVDSLQRSGKASKHNHEVQDVGLMLNKRESVRQRTLRDSSLGVSNLQKRATSKENLVEVINDAKNREVKRLNSTLIQIDSNELTEDAINQLGNLAIVQPNEELIRRHQDKDIEQVAGNHRPWHGRKNFKNFVKIQPKYKSHQLGDKYREGSSDFIRNSAFLLTREYVPLKPFSKQQQDSTEEFPKITKRKLVSSVGTNERHEYHPREELNSEGDSNGPSPPQVLFVVDEDDSQHAPSMQPENEFAPNESIEIPNAFQPDFASAASSKRVGSLGQDQSHFSTAEDGIGGDDDEDDEDDDDEPKFKFRRRMR